MQTKADPDLTLPAVVANLPGRDSEQRLLLTVIFHPDTRRIGEVATVAAPTGTRPRVLGRCSPVFGRGDIGPAVPLDEGHVSRQALLLAAEGDRLVLRRPEGSSRCRVGGRELDQAIELSPDQLLAGVPLLLGHSVVLLLRRTPWTGPPPPAAPACPALPKSPARGGFEKNKGIFLLIISALEFGLSIFFQETFVFLGEENYLCACFEKHPFLG